MCLPSPCENEGVCTESSTALEGYSCQCRDSWAGRICNGKYCLVKLLLNKQITIQFFF